MTGECLGALGVTGWMSRCSGGGLVDVSPFWGWQKATPRAPTCMITNVYEWWLVRTNVSRCVCQFHFSGGLLGRTFVRPNHHSYTFTHLVDVLTQFTNFHSFSQGNMYPVYLTGDVPPPITPESTWFTLTTATPTLKQHLFPKLLRL